jgi:hypothetical protein
LGEIPNREMMMASSRSWTSSDNCTWTREATSPLSKHVLHKRITRSEIPGVPTEIRAISHSFQRNTNRFILPRVSGVYIFVTCIS